METLTLGRELEVREPGVLLDPRLPVGRYRATLIVTSARGESLPAVLNIIVREASTPTPLRPSGPRRPAEPRPVPPAQAARKTPAQRPRKPK